MLRRTMHVGRVTHASWKYVIMRDKGGVRDAWGMRTDETRTWWRMGYAWGWRFHFYPMGVLDMFDRLGARQHREWMEGGVCLSKRGEDAVRSWGRESFGVWSDSETWSAGSMRGRKGGSRCPPPAIQWVTRVVGSKWWTDRVGVEDFLLRPVHFLPPNGAKGFRVSAEEGCEKWVSCGGSTEGSLSLDLLRRKKDSPIILAQLDAFARRFWGEKLREGVMGRIRELGGKGLL